MTTQESLDNLEKIYSYTQSPDITRLLYVVFKEDIDKMFQEGKRVISVEFASTKRLVEWFANADCDTPVILNGATAEEGAKYISSRYPNVTKVLHERKDVCVILLQTNAIIFSQCFAATAILPQNVDYIAIKEKYPKHLSLKHQ